MDTRTISHAHKYVFEHGERRARQSGTVGFRLAPLTLQGKDAAEILGRIGIDYRAPADFMDLAANSADLVVSRAVLEHISPTSLMAIFRHAAKVLRPGGVMCHSIDLSDHFEHQDKSISRVNFLQYEDAVWRLTGLNPQNYQNRLRRFEYVDLLKSAGFDILHADGERHGPSVEALKTMRLCRRYQGVDPEELAIISTDIVCRRAG